MAKKDPAIEKLIIETELSIQLELREKRPNTRKIQKLSKALRLLKS